MTRNPDGSVPDPGEALSRNALMRPLFKPVTIMVCALLLSACATRPPAPSEALSAQPFVLERDLLGETTARGEFRTITGVRRPFTATLNGSMDGASFVLVEDFVYDDGERDTKTWRLERTASGEFSGTREDVVGLARGFQDGPYFRLEYDVRLPSENGRGRVVRFRDILALSETGVVNNATVGWYGFRVGSVQLSIERATPGR